MPLFMVKSAWCVRIVSEAVLVVIFPPAALSISVTWHPFVMFNAAALALLVHILPFKSIVNVPELTSTVSDVVASASSFTVLFGLLFATVMAVSSVGYLKVSPPEDVTS